MKSLSFLVLSTSLRVLSSAAVFFSSPAHVLAEWTEWSVDSEIAYSFQDNINHSLFVDAEESDHIWSALSSLGRAYQLTNNTRIDVGASVDGNIHLNFGKLNQLNTGINLAVQHKFGLGPYQPWLRGSVATSHIFSRSQLRNGQVTTVGVDLGKRVHDRIGLVLSYRFDNRNSHDTGGAIDANRLIAAGIDPGKPSNVFDIQGHSIGVQVNALLTRQWVLILGYNYRDGDIVSTNSPALVPQIDSIVDAIADDDALPGWAYRADGKTHQYSVDANYTFLKGHAAFNIGYEYTESHAAPFSYRNNLFRVSLIYNF